VPTTTGTKAKRRVAFSYRSRGKRSRSARSETSHTAESVRWQVGANPCKYPNRPNREKKRAGPQRSVDPASVPTRKRPLVTKILAQGLIGFRRPIGHGRRCDTGLLQNPRDQLGEGCQRLRGFVDLLEIVLLVQVQQAVFRAACRHGELQDRTPTADSSCAATGSDCPCPKRQKTPWFAPSRAGGDEDLRKGRSMKRRVARCGR